MVSFSWLVLLLLHPALPQTTDRYSDEDRPYKFGFNIQGYQHRQEEKDEKGLIKGEYGFITADGYYRVTVYATDENGDFRIISMKNYYVGFPPEDPTTTPGAPAERARQPQRPPAFGGSQGPTGRALQGGDSGARAPKAFTRPQGIAACSDCSIPTTTPKTNQQNLVLDRGDFRTGRTGAGTPGLFPQTAGNPQAPGQNTPPVPLTAQGPSGGQTPGFPQGAPRSGTAPGLGGPSDGGFSPRSGTAPDLGGPSDGGFSPRSGTAPGFGGPSDGSSPRSGSGPRPSGRAFRPADNQGRNDLDAGKPRPQVGVVRDGLPPGVSVSDIKDLLYTFNYTVGFHGHHEDGYRNGDKQGDYFFDGRDGVERKVEYLANEFGYQPNITLIDLADNDVRRPNEQTEKEYGLKGYEFKWFYRK